MAAKTKTTALHPCACSTFEFGEFDGNNEAAESYDTGCTRQTNRIFAQGHDAKLVGFMVRAELAGEEIRMIDGGVAITFIGAVAAAGRISDALAIKAQAQLDAARARVAKAAAREASKAARKSAKKAEAANQPTTREAAIKVGRWIYDATIELATGTATFTSKKGEVKTAVHGEYTEVTSA